MGLSPSPRTNDELTRLALEFCKCTDETVSNAIFATLYKMVRSRVFNWHLRWCARKFAAEGDQSCRQGGPAWDAADDLTEDTLHQFAARKQFRGEAAFTTWLYRVAYNEFVNWLRKRERDVCQGAKSLEEPISNENSEPLTLEDIRPDFKLRHDKIVLLYRFLDQAIPNDMWREAFCLRYLEEMKLKEIAEALNRSVAAVWGYIENAKRAVQARADHRIKWPGDEED